MKIQMLTVTRTFCFAIALLICSAIGNADSPTMSNFPSIAPNLPAQLYPVSAVRLLPGPFADAVKVNREYVLAHDADKLLAPFRREAGPKPKKESYGNWENIGLDGHTAGHYLSALAQQWFTDLECAWDSRLDRLRKQYETE
jgi:DUF1680 family protein